MDHKHCRRAGCKDHATKRVSVALTNNADVSRRTDLGNGCNEGLERGRINGRLLLEATATGTRVLGVGPVKSAVVDGDDVGGRGKQAAWA